MLWLVPLMMIKFIDSAILMFITDDGSHNEPEMSV